MMTTKFHLGELFATLGVVELVRHTHLDLGPLIDSHSSGDWGDAGKTQKDANDIALDLGGVVTSMYHPRGTRIWVITNAERTRTNIMLSHEKER